MFHNFFNEIVKISSCKFEEKVHEIGRETVKIELFCVHLCIHM